MKLKGLSLFANVGIAETYIGNTVDIKVANELLEDRAKFYKEMHKHTNMIQGDILDDEIFDNIISTSIKEECDFLMATPPCQGMSVAGKMEENDPRNSLIIKVIKAITKIKPKYFLIENVQKMIKTFIHHNNEKIIIKDFILNELEKEYNINFNVMDAADYGTPQNRKRSITLGTLKEKTEWVIPPKSNKQITVKDAIGHLPSLESLETSNIPYHNAKKHNERHIKWMEHTPSGETAFNNKVHYPKKENGERIKGFLSTYKRMSWSKPAPTITMGNGGISSQNNVHPGRMLPNGKYSDARVLTLKEIFILTGLPNNWNPPKWASENLIRKVIGEGVPPKLIEELVNNIVI